MQPEIPAIQGFYKQYGEALDQAISVNLRRRPNPHEDVRNPLGCAFWTTFKRATIHNEALVAKTDLIIENTAIPDLGEYVYIFTKRRLTETRVLEFPSYIPLTADEFHIFADALVHNEPYVDITRLAEDWVNQAKAEGVELSIPDSEHWIQSVLEEKMSLLREAGMVFGFGQVVKPDGINGTIAPNGQDEYAKLLGNISDEINQYYWQGETSDETENVALDPTHSYFILPVTELPEIDINTELNKLIAQVDKFVPQNFEEHELLELIKRSPFAVTAYELSTINPLTGIIKLAKPLERINELLSEVRLKYEMHEGLGFVLEEINSSAQGENIGRLYDRWQQILAEHIASEEILMNRDSIVRLTDVNLLELIPNPQHPSYYPQKQYFPKSGKVIMSGSVRMSDNGPQFLFLPPAQFGAFWEIVRSKNGLDLPQSGLKKTRFKELLSRLNGNLIRWGFGSPEQPYLIIDDSAGKVFISDM